MALGLPPGFHLYEEFLAFHEQRREECQRASSDGQCPDVLHRICDGANGSFSDGLVSVVEDDALGSRQSVTDLLGRVVVGGEGGGEVLVGEVLEDCTGNGKGDDDTADLGQVLEGYTRWEKDTLANDEWGCIRGGKTYTAEMSSIFTLAADTEYPAWTTTPVPIARMTL